MVAFLQLVGSPGEGLLHNELQQCPKALGMRKGTAGENSFQLPAHGNLGRKRFVLNSFRH
jgi:hypothetical protein